VAVPLALPDFLSAWKADGLYTRAPYAFWTIRERVRQPDTDELYRRALARGLDNMRGGAGPDGVSRVASAAAIRALAEDLATGRAAEALPLSCRFSFRVSGQRCHDAARFIRQAPFAHASLAEASRVRAEQARGYGEAQAGAAASDVKRVAGAMGRVAALEDAFTDALAAGLAAIDR
jgi:hypothetical protein